MEKQHEVLGTLKELLDSYESVISDTDRMLEWEIKMQWTIDYLIGIKDTTVYEYVIKNKKILK